jgi:hypothetical protein
LGVNGLAVPPQGNVLMRRVPNGRQPVDEAKTLSRWCRPFRDRGRAERLNGTGATTLFSDMMT